MNRFLTFCLAFVSIECYSQWTTLSTPATENLNDLDFLNQDIGVITGDFSTVLYTDDGGLSWSDISGNLPMFNVHGVKIFSEDIIVVSVYNFNTATGYIYITFDGGGLWTLLLTDAGINHKPDLETNTPLRLWALGGNLYSTSNFGAVSWDTLVTNTGGMTAMDVIEFADSSTGHISGLISGFSTYSAVFSRTEDGGDHWYPGDVFSFPNADAFTAMCFLNDDTAFYCMNQYQGFIPSNINKLIKIYDFNKISPFPGDTMFAFSYQETNLSMPAYINDIRFFNSTDGIALGEDGTVYASTDGGVTWNPDYSVSTALKKMEVQDSVIYAVGNNGTVIKYGGITNVKEPEGSSFSLYPNPGTDRLFLTAKGKGTIRITSSEGKRLAELNFNDRIEYDTHDLPAGLYFITLISEGHYSTTKKWVKE